MSDFAILCTILLMSVIAVFALLFNVGIGPKKSRTKVSILGVFLMVTTCCAIFAIDLRGIEAKQQVAYLMLGVYTLVYLVSMGYFLIRLYTSSH